MIYLLSCYPDTPCPEVESLSATITLSSERNLCLTYCLQGNLPLLHIPTLQQPCVQEGLWEHTCFEAFLATKNSLSYQEFNFSPSGCWASYLFSHYRVQRNWLSKHIYDIQVQLSDNQLVLTVTVPLTEMPLLDTEKPIQINLTAVIESAAGQRSYWAIHHPSHKPDFHDRAGFTSLL
jgi:hypothetical protein